MSRLNITCFKNYKFKLILYTELFFKYIVKQHRTKETN